MTNINVRDLPTSDQLADHADEQMKHAMTTAEQWSTVATSLYRPTVRHLLASGLKEPAAEQHAAQWRAAVDKVAQAHRELAAALAMLGATENTLHQTALKSRRTYGLPRQQAGAPLR